MGEGLDGSRRLWGLALTQSRASCSVNAGTPGRVTRIAGLPSGIVGSGVPTGGMLDDGVDLIDGRVNVATIDADPAGKVANIGADPRAPA